MSRHPLDVLSLAFGTIFGVMALVGLAEAAGIVDDGLTTTLVGVALAATVTGVAASIRGLLSSGDSPPTSAGDADVDDPLRL